MYIKIHFTLMRTSIILPSIIFVLLVASCEIDKNTTNLPSENVVLVVVDGARYSEFWGDSLHQNSPYLYNYLAPNGVVCTQFYNQGVTTTVSGHTAILTGVYQEINNLGLEFPNHPSIMQFYNKHKQAGINSCWIISSKKKIEALRNCKSSQWADKYLPNIDCGVNDSINNNRPDSLTFKRLIEILREEQPKLTLVSFMEPDVFAHQKNWQDYNNAIKQSDKYIYHIWNFINSHPTYKNKTSLLITNDHGRHNDDVQNGYISHGDTCSGCRHIFLYAYGPQIKRNHIIDTKYHLIDIFPTLAELMKIEVHPTQGEIMYELLSSQ